MSFGMRAKRGEAPIEGAVADADEAIGKADHSVREAHSMLVPAPGRQWSGNRRKAFRILFHLHPPEARLCSSTDQKGSASDNFDQNRQCELPTPKPRAKTVLAPKPRAGFARGLRAGKGMPSAFPPSAAARLLCAVCIQFLTVTVLLRPSPDQDREVKK
eukprot:scaffold34139_cov53-Phaeocystis_antarctica.AAC.1